MKNLSGLNNGTQDLPKLRSALKLSTTVPPPTIQMDNLGITTENSSKSSKKESKTKRKFFRTWWFSHGQDKNKKK